MKCLGPTESCDICVYTCPSEISPYGAREFSVFNAPSTIYDIQRSITLWSVIFTAIIIASEDHPEIWTPQ